MFLNTLTFICRNIDRYTYFAWTAVKWNKLPSKPIKFHFLTSGDWHLIHFSVYQENENLSTVTESRLDNAPTHTVNEWSRCASQEFLDSDARQSQKDRHAEQVVCVCVCVSMSSSWARVKPRETVDSLWTILHAHRKKRVSYCTALTRTKSVLNVLNVYYCTTVVFF